MSNPIVARLFERRRSVVFDDLREDADDEYKDLNDDNTDTDNADDDADVSADETEEETPDEASTTPEDSENDDSQAPNISNSSTHSSLPKTGAPQSPNLPDDAEDAPEEETPVDDGIPEDDDIDNPLDNRYAVTYHMGDEIVLSNNHGHNDNTLKGEIDGYDPEGFYRVKWSDGTTTNGLTDIALSSLIKKTTQATHESKCVCGGKEFIVEGTQYVCDKCGRSLREGDDPLMLADKARPKSKKMIRSEAHPMSTAVKPSINEAADTDDVFHTYLGYLKSLENQFWSRLDELVEDIEAISGFKVVEKNPEYIVIEADFDEDDNLYLPLGGTARTMTIDLSRAKLI